MDGIEKMPDIKIVPATPEDAGSIQQLLRASVLATYVNEEREITAEDMEERYRSQFSSEGLEKIAKNLTEPSPGTTYLVAKENDAVIGYCKITENQEENELTRLHVLPDKKGGGVGSLFWKKVQTVLNPHKNTVLWVVDYNEKAKQIYEHWGFTETGEKRQEILKSGALRAELKMVLKKSVSDPPSTGQQQWSNFGNF